MNKLELSLYNWQNNLGFYEVLSSRKTFAVEAFEGALSISYRVEFISNSKDIIVSIRYLGHGEFLRYDTEYIVKIFTIVKNIIEDTFCISITDDLFMQYVLNKVQRGTSTTLCKMYINIKDLIKFV